MLVLGGSLPMKCSRCNTRDDENRLLPECVASRKRWACDEPIPEDKPPLVPADQLETTLDLRRCPWAEAVPNVRHALPYLELAHTQHLLPVPGGTLDQSADFVAALVLYGKLRARVESEQMEEARQKQRIKT